jgi:hypothetical protein
MDWGAYEVFSVLSGITMLIMGLVPGLSVKERLGVLAGGAFFLVYGICVASQDSGIWLFPIWIFVIPFVGVGLGIGRLVAVFSTDQDEEKTRMSRGGQSQVH